VSYGIEPHGKLTPGSIFIHGILNPHGILTPAPISNQEMGREVKISWVGGSQNTLDRGVNISWVGGSIYHG
jgi:hypothetical protein